MTGRWKEVPGFRGGRPVTAARMQAADRTAIEGYGIPSLVLMENAARAVADEVLRGLRRGPGGRVVVVCGTGNNGGDGLAAVRHLLNAGVVPRTFLCGGPDRLKPDAAVQYRILQACGHAVAVLPESSDRLRRAVRGAAWVVDALFGVGLNRPLSELHRGIIGTINAATGRILAVDVPSGLDATTGRVWGACVRAGVTVALARPKTGFYRNEGPARCGRILTADIGIPEVVFRRRK